jgi:hypothetical protein
MDFEVSCRHAAPSNYRGTSKFAIADSGVLTIVTEDDKIIRLSPSFWQSVETVLDPVPDVEI